MNFYFDAEPHFAVGSVVKAAGEGYLWRCYADPFAAAGAEPASRLPSSALPTFAGKRQHRLICRADPSPALRC
jgi:hypothetical protein